MLSSVISRLNDRRDAAADLGEDAGFTLIELMVVLLILAILLAIAIPTFLGVTGGANDRAAQSNLNTALTTAKSAETQNQQTYLGLGTTGTTPQNLSADEPSISWQGGSVTTQGPVSFYVDNVTTPSAGQGIILASFSKNNSTCWYVIDNIGAVTQAGNGGFTKVPAAEAQPGTYYGSVTNAKTCDATDATANGAGAVTNWGAHF
jgi:type IV pilus assembly protein PilA